MNKTAPLLRTTSQQDTRAAIRRTCLARWALFTVSILIFIGIILFALFMPFENDREGVQIVPSKLVVKDTKVRIQLGTLRRKDGGQKGQGQEEGDKEEKVGGLVSDVLIESANVHAMTIHVLEAKVFRGGVAEGGEKGSVTRNYKTIVIEENDELMGRKDEDPTLMVNRVQSDTGTFLNFFISSPSSQLPDNKLTHGRTRREESIVAGRLRLRIEVPLGFAGELTIDGSVLNIEGTSSLAKACFTLLHLTTDEGNIILGINDDDNSDSTEPNLPTLQVAHLYARIHQKGSFHVGYLGSAEKGKPIRVNIETQEGDISINALQTMLSFDVDKEYPVDDEVIHFLSLVTHRGDIRMHLREGESLLGPWYVRGFVMVMARAHSGIIQGRVEIPDLQLLILDAVSDHGTALEVVSSHPNRQAYMPFFSWQGKLRIKPSVLF